MKSLKQVLATSPFLQELSDISAYADEVRRRRIERYGFAADCECDLCGDSGIEAEKGRYCSCDLGRSMGQTKERQDAWPDVCPARFTDCRIETHPDRNAAALVRKWVEVGFKERRNLILTGPVGTGKSGLAIGAMYEIHMQGKSCMFETFSLILDQLRPRDDFDKTAKSENLASMIRKGLLVIDDLGTHKESEWTAEQLFDLINGRTSTTRPFIVTTNWTTTEMADALDDRLMSRLVESTERLSGCRPRPAQKRACSMSTIHPAWLRPMPKYWNDFYERDHPLLDVPAVAWNPDLPDPRQCDNCGILFQPKQQRFAGQRFCPRKSCIQDRNRQVKANKRAEVA